MGDEMIRAIEDRAYCEGVTIVAKTATSDSEAPHPEAENLLQNELLVVPNPNSGQFAIRLESPVEGELEIFDLYGRRVKSRQLEGQENQIAVDLSHEPKGIFIVRSRRGDPSHV